MAELADAAGLGPVGRKPLEVRVLSPALGAVEQAGLYLRAVRRIVGRGRLSPRGALGPLDERLVFVLGCPRSGTSFLASSIGSLPGFVDLGEVHPVKAAVPRLSHVEPEEAAPVLRRILTRTRRLGLVAGLRAVEQTPETAFVAPALAVAFPDARFVHVVRDGRDVVCSLLERGWLSAGRSGGDDVGAAYGPSSRFWVEPWREPEFGAASDTRRAAWAWRAYVSAGRALDAPVHEVRYEAMVREPDETAAALAGFLAESPAPLVARLRTAHARSVGRFRAELSAGQLAEIEAEAGTLLRGLGYSSPERTRA